MFRSEHNAVLEQYRTKLKNDLKVYESMPRAIELHHQQDVLTKLCSQLQEAKAQHETKEPQLSERCHPGLLEFEALASLHTLCFEGYLTDTCLHLAALCKPCCSQHYAAAL